MKKTRAGHRVSRATGDGTTHPRDAGQSFPIGGIGASAGGLQAFSALLKRLPLDFAASQDARAAPIDFFFEALAQDQRERAIGVILSGTARSVWRQSRPKAGLRSRRMKPRVTTRCHEARSPQAAWTSCSPPRTLPPRSHASRRTRQSHMPHPSGKRRTIRRKTEFLAMLAHELRNPLAPILISIGILRRSLHVEEPDPGRRGPVSRALNVLDRQVGQMVRLIDDLLDAGRISRGKVELRKQRAEL